MEYTVRIAKPEDEAEVHAFLKLMHEENGIFEWDDEKTREFISRATSRRYGVIGIIEGDEALEGMICLIPDQLWYSSDWFLNEVFNFVHPDYRRSTRAKDLIAFAKNISDEMQLPLILGVVSNYRTEAKVKLYERQFPKAGAFFMYNNSLTRVPNHG
jgi:hypothetical protein